MKKTAVTFLCAVSFLMSACFSPWRPDEAVLILNLGGGADNRAVMPDEETIKNLEHKIHLSGPAEMDIKLEKGVLTARITVTPGRWDITIQAFLDGELYAEGSGSVTITAAQNYPVSIPMRYAGIHYYTVSFDSNGGTPVESQEVGEGGKVKRPDDPEKAGYSFAGWYGDNNTFQTRWSFAGNTVTGDITLYAKWDAAAVTTYYTVTFGANGGEGETPEAKTVAAGSSVELPGGSGLSRANASFGGWVIDPDATAAQFAAGAFFTVNEDITLYAFWNTSTVTYTVTFHVNGGDGSVPDPIPTQAGSGIIIPGGSGLSRTGFTFGGWNTRDDGTGFNYNAGDSYTVNGDIGLYARWLAVGATLYTVTFHANGGDGTVPSPQPVDEGSSIEIPNGDGLSRTGYTFGGWNTDEDGTGENHSAGSSYTPIGNITLYARWEPVTTEPPEEGIDVDIDWGNIVEGGKS